VKQRLQFCDNFYGLVKLCFNLVHWLKETLTQDFIFLLIGTFRIYIEVQVKKLCVTVVAEPEHTGNLFCEVLFGIFCCL